MKSFISKLTIFLTIFSSALVTIQAAGVLDSTFGVNGRVSIPIGISVRATAVAVQPDGKILVLGSANNVGAWNTVLVRYNTNGSPDTSFGNGGIFNFTLSFSDETASDLALQSDGKIVVAGNLFSTTTQSIDFFVARVNTNGTLDTTFGTNGLTTVNQSSNDVLNAVAIHPDGKIVAVGGISTNGGEAAILKLNSNGTLDNTFGEGGLLFINYPNLTGERFQKVVLLPSAPPVGRIMVSGQGTASVPHTFTQNFLSSLYYSNGSACQDFGTQCVVNFGAGSAAPPLDFSVLPDGKILTVSDGTRRFLSNGAVDPSFTTGGFGSELAVRSDGRFVVGGSFYTNSDTRLYGGSGRYIGRARVPEAADIAVQANDKFVFVSSTQTDFVVTRLNTITSQGTRLADFEPDDKTDLIVYRPGNRTHYMLTSQGGNFVIKTSSVPALRTIPERFDVARSDFIYWNAAATSGAAGSFYGEFDSNPGEDSFQWGISGDIPVPGDYDGDGRHDVAIFRDGLWYIQQSTGGLKIVQWGIAGDKPISVRYDQ